MKNIIPHPSEYIVDELNERGWSVSDLANKMGHNDCVLNKLSLDLYFEVGPSKPNLQLGKNMGEKLARAFDVGSTLLFNLEKSWLEQQGTEQAYP